MVACAAAAEGLTVRPRSGTVSSDPAIERMSQKPPLALAPPLLSNAGSHSEAFCASARRNTLAGSLR